MDLRDNTLRKDERLSGKKSIATLLADGRWGSYACLRYCWLAREVPEGEEVPASRVLVAVPKRLFKRAVKRNLLKRRIREAWRRQKIAGIDILLQYNSPEPAAYREIWNAVAGIVRKIGGTSDTGGGEQQSVQ